MSRLYLDSCANVLFISMFFTKVTGTHNVILEEKCFEDRGP
jgi:hypothetical protein